MTRYLLVRTAILILGCLLTSLIIFAALRVLPGDVAQIIGGTHASAERITTIREQLGLDTPAIIQYLDWINGILHGDLGNSALTGTPVAQELAEKAEVTIPLTLLALLIALLFSLPLGVTAAYHHGTLASRTLSAASLLTASIPVIWAGLISTLIFSNWLGWFPSQGFPRNGWESPLQALTSLMLPALTIGSIMGAILFRFVRSATLTALEAEHVRTAMSQGLTRLTALITHGLPGVGLSIISILGLQAAELLVGAVIVERLFNLPGLGSMLISDVSVRDLPKVQSTLLLLTAMILIIGTTVDVVHRLIDPRLRNTAA